MGKGFLERLSDAKERLENVVGGAAGAGDAALDLAFDLAQAPFTDDEYGGIIDTLYSAGTKHTGILLENLIGPDEGLGAAIGGIPESVRRPVSSALGPVMEGLETAYREGVGEPLSTAFILNRESGLPVPNVGAAPAIVQAVTDPLSVRDAYREAQHTSPGQAVAQEFMAPGKSLTDEEIAELAGTDEYKMISGLSDALIRFTLDPTVVGGKAVKAARGRYVAKNATTGELSIARKKVLTQNDIAVALETTRSKKFLTALDGMDAGRIRHQFFPEHQDGAYIADLLANAGSGLDDAARLEAKRKVLASMLGDKQAYADLVAEAPDFAHQIRNLTTKANDDLSVLEQTEHNLRQFGHTELADKFVARISERKQRLEMEMQVLYPEMDRVTKITDTFAAMEEVPRYSYTGAKRADITASAFYQKNPLTKPLRTISNMVPQHWVNLNDPRSDIQVQRALRDSGLDVDTQMALRGKYQGAVNAADRQRIAIEIEEAITRKILDEYDVPKVAVDKIIAEAARMRTNAMGALSRRSYDAKGRGSMVVEEADGSLTRIALPLHVTQQANLLPMVDVKQLRHAAQAASGQGLVGKYRGVRMAHEVTDLPANVLEAFYSVWRPATLLRVGWPARVLLDEQLRIVATIGALAHYGKLAQQLPRYVSQTAKRVPRREASPVSRALRIKTATPDDIAAGNVYKGLGDAEVQIGDYTLPPAFGYPGDAANYYRQLNSASGTFREIVDADRNVLLKELRKGTGEFRNYMPTEADYPNWWAHNVNHQIKQSAFARLALEGKSTDEMAEWLLKSDEGAAYARQMGWRPHNFDKHAEDVADQVNRYVPTPELRAAALERDLSYDDLTKALPDQDLHPAVHGEDLAQALGESALRRMTRNTINGAWKNLGQLPTDTLSRNPFFDAVYRSEAERLVNLLDDGVALGADDLTRISAQARRKALNESQKLLYDLAEKSQFAEMMRFISPFYMAWQEVLTRWTGIAIQNPAFIARARMIWNAPEKAGLVVDENGALIDEEGNATDPLTGKKVEAGEDRYITVPFPIPGMPNDGPMRFNKRSLNLLLQGTPGAGPPVQVPVNEIVKKRPELEKSVEFILPFGTTQETWQMLIPATGRRLFSRSQQEEDRVFRNTAIRMWQDRMVDFNLGKREDKPTWDEVMKDTTALYSVRTVANYVAPFTPVFDSPYQPYINAYRQAQTRLREDDMALADEDGNKRSADEWFYDEFGEEFFPLTQSLSQSRDGIMPTIEGLRAREKYEALVEKYPELGGLIVGKEGAGEYAGAVYDYQLANEVSPGSGTKQRELPSFDEVQTRIPARQGWIEYRRAMDMIENERVRRGLPNLQVKAARDLAADKRAVTQQLAEKYPEWYAQMNVVDRGAMTRRIDAMRDIAEKFEGRKDRPEMRGLSEYLRARDVFSAELARRGERRGAKTLTAKSNMDLARDWDTFTSRLVEENPAFADLFYRYLERDTPEAAA